MNNNASTRPAPIPSQDQIEAHFTALPAMVAFNIEVDGVYVQIRRSALTADSRLGSIAERIERLVPYAVMYEETVVVD